MDWAMINEAVIFAIAVLGAVLGVINTIHNMNKSHVKLRVAPQYMFIAGTPPMFSIAVLNRSEFPVTIREIGFKFRSPFFRSNRMLILNPKTIDGSTLPKRLEPREVITAYFELADIEPNISKISKAYATTVCDETRYGTSGALKQVRKESYQLRKKF